jgi:Predicted membrane protein
MTKTKMILIPAALIASLPLAAMAAERLSPAEVTQFQSAAVSLDQAGATALQNHPGALASVTYGDEDGRMGYEVVVIGADGQPWTVLVDAQSGDVFASAASSAMNDHEDQANGHDDHEDGEEDDD